MITQQSSSAIQTTRASSKPHCSLARPLGERSGSGSIDQSRGAVRRARDGQVGDAAPILDPGEQDGRAVDERGGRVEHGVDGIRPVVGGEDRVRRVPLEELARGHAVTRLGRAGSGGGADAGGVEEKRRAMERERRLRALVLVQRLAPEPVAAAAGGEVVERFLQAVAAEEPLERPDRARAVLRIAGRGVRGQLGLDESGGVERLLVPGVRARARRAAGRGAR